MQIDPAPFVVHHDLGALGHQIEGDDCQHQTQPREPVSSQDEVLDFARRLPDPHDAETGFDVEVKQHVGIPWQLPKTLLPIRRRAPL